METGKTVAYIGIPQQYADLLRKLEEHAARCVYTGGDFTLDCFSPLDGTELSNHTSGRPPITKLITCLEHYEDNDVGKRNPKKAMQEFLAQKNKYRSKKSRRNGR